MPPNDTPKPVEMCTIRVAFPVESDEQAIEYKKKIADVLAPIPDAQIQFGLMSLPTGAKPGNGIQ